MMRTEPNYQASDLGLIRVPVAIVLGEHDEFIKPDHAEYLARSIPNAEMICLTGVSHFAPLQRPGKFNVAVVNFLDDIGTRKNEDLRR
jgi:pimeloyl-ACP methyl ester carboxylesterase